MNEEEYIGNIKRRSGGFTVVELLIVVCIVGIVAAVIFGGITGTAGRADNSSWDFNGRVEQRCINGFMFTVDSQGSARQVMNEFGKGVRCQ